LKLQVEEVGDLMLFAGGDIYFGGFKILSSFIDSFIDPSLWLASMI